jgi:hypothetical protein
VDFCFPSNKILYLKKHGPCNFCQVSKLLDFSGDMLPDESYTCLFQGFGLETWLHSLSLISVLTLEINCFDFFRLSGERAELTPPSMGEHCGRWLTGSVCQAAGSQGLIIPFAIHQKGVRYCTSQRSPGKQAVGCMPAGCCE